ncbi:MAG: xanthine phosphoribosyltransferase [Tissierellia bacterium]|nr:xanthine phosphoribosyltransferase [Tissierellia bacterium]
MKLLKDRILQDGTVEEDILKVGSFLNHQIDVKLLNEIGKEFKERFKDKKVDKILTIETSGIAIAVIAAQYFHVPVVFARKTESKTMDKDLYESTVYSYTKEKNYTIKVSKKFLNEGENVLLIDDFLARGRAIEGLIDILKQANVNLVGVGIVIEKGFQEGGKVLRDKGILIESLAIIDKPVDGKIKFM